MSSNALDSDSIALIYLVPGLFDSPRIFLTSCIASFEKSDSQSYPDFPYVNVYYCA